MGEIIVIIATGISLGICFGILGLVGLVIGVRRAFRK